MQKRIHKILQQKDVGSKVQVQGWIRTRRDTGSFSFLEVNDGSCLGVAVRVCGDNHNRLTIELAWPLVNDSAFHVSLLCVVREPKPPLVG